MILNIYCIPLMSIESERVFSSTKHMISAERAALQPATIDALECVKHWMRAGIYTDIELTAIMALLTATEEESDR